MEELHLKSDMHEARLTTLEVTLDTIKSDLDGLKQVLNVITKRLETIGRPNMQIILAGIAVLITLITLIGGTVLAPLYIYSSENSSRIEEVRREKTSLIKDLRLDTERQLKHLKREFLLRNECGQACSNID